MKLLEQIASIGGLGGLTAAVAAGATWLKIRNGSKASLEKIALAMIDQATGNLRLDCDEARKDAKEAKAEVAECRREHEHCRGELDDMKRLRTEDRKLIDQLMAERPQTEPVLIARRARKSRAPK